MPHSDTTTDCARGREMRLYRFTVNVPSKDVPMKFVTEFANFQLNKAIKEKEALVSGGKTPEEVQTALGETYKMEGDKLKHFVNALDIASQNSENLKRVLVVSLAETEKAPAKATKIEEHHYVPEFHVDPKRQAPSKDDRGGKGGRGGRGGGRGGGDRGKKESPWGLSPEEQAAKKAKGAGGPTPNPTPNPTPKK